MSGETDGLSGRIRRARLELGLSQQELADRVRVSQPTIVHWEQGTHVPRHLALTRLADALSVSRTWLVGEAVPAMPRHGGGAPRGLRAPVTDPRHAYLGQPLLHVPVHPWQDDAGALQGLVEGAREPVEVIAWSGPLLRPLGVLAGDVAVRRTFPEGGCLVLECAPSDLDQLRDGAWYLVVEAGRCAVRRWQRGPDRFEADLLRDALVDLARVRAVGRVVGLLCRF